jgi:hypothetical protein
MMQKGSGTCRYCGTYLNHLMDLVKAWHLFLTELRLIYWLCS